MLESTQQSVRYYLFSLSNFMAAVGGGMILGKGVATIQIPWLKESSLLAFFVGTVLGLLLLQCTPKQFSKIFSRWFSICGGVTSLILLALFLKFNSNETIAGNPAILFFILLSVRFGFWFYSRVLRAADAAGQKQRIAWVEFGYYTGVIVGLILWLLLKIDIGMAYTLLLDAFLQFGAGLLDLSANRLNVNPMLKSPQGREAQTVSPYNTTPAWLWRLAIAVMLLTVGVQVIIFNLAHQVSSHFSPYMLAIFYFGAAVSSLFCKHFNVRLEWYSTSNNHGYATILITHAGRNKNINLLLLTVLSAGFVGAATLIVCWYLNIMHIQGLASLQKFWLLIFVFVSTFFYQMVELAILDRIGLEEKQYLQKGMILRTYGIMSIAAAISLWLLEVAHNSLFALFVTLIGCFLFTFLSIWKRNFREEITFAP